MTEHLTSQKKFILDYLKATKNHPSALEIYREIKKKLPRLSLGTVYRILDQLREKGEILEIPGEISRFDGHLSFHAHFICQQCKRIFDIQNAEKMEKFLKKQKLKIGKVENCQIYFYGKCQNCENKRSKIKTKNKK